MSSPTSAMITWAALTPMPGISSRRLIAGSPPGTAGWSVSSPVWLAFSGGGWAAGMAPISSWMRLVSLSMWTPSASIWSRSIRASSAWWSLKRPVSACTRAARLPRIRPLASSASTLGHAAQRSASPPCPTRGAHDVGRHGGQLGSGRPRAACSSRCTCRARSWVRSDRSRVSSRTWRISAGGMNEGAACPAR